MSKRPEDRELAIYGELAGHYEKLVALAVALVNIIQGAPERRYQKAKARRSYANLR